MLSSEGAELLPFPRILVGFCCSPARPAQLLPGAAASWAEAPQRCRGLPGMSCSGTRAGMGMSCALPRAGSCWSSASAPFPPEGIPLVMENLPLTAGLGSALLELIGFQIGAASTHCFSEGIIWKFPVSNKDP